MKNMSKVLWGIVLIGIGVIIGLNSLEITNIDVFFDGWWTLFIIIPCFIDLFNEKEEKTGNIIGLAIGVALLLACRGILPIGIILKLIVPFIFIAIGLSLIMKNTLKRKISEKIESKKKDGLETIVATFSEQKIERDGEKFEGASLDAVFGGITLDLRDAKLGSETVIEASAIFGGITVLVPKDVVVKIKPTSIFGGVSNHYSKDTGAKKVIYMDAFCLFGGIDIK